MKGLLIDLNLEILIAQVVGLARAMIKHCKKVEELGDVVDIVGTGGDGANTEISQPDRLY